MHSGIALGVNIDHIATLRQQRHTRYPEPVQAALLAEHAGADNITLHLREDRRHIQERDLRLLRPLVTNRLNLEMASLDAIADLACEVKPDECTLVPERREELTTEGGLDVVAHEAAVARVVRRLKECDICVSLFIDPNAVQIHAARMLGANAVEIQTARYSEAKTQAAREEELAALQEAAILARDQGLHVHMGHGLNYSNVQPVSAIAEVEELNIGHSIVSRSLLVGMERAVRDMKEAIRQGRG